jgi:NAD(P)-dependent dehydrogenase (short-subunit alcohol dehydrogenase family)
MNEQIRFHGGTAVITGAASGIGAGLARKAAQLGINLVLADLNAGQLDAFAATLETNVVCVPTDVSDPAAVEALAARAWEAFGGVDLLFNNAGIMSTGFSWQIEPARFARSFDVNVNGVLNGIRAFVPRMLATGTPAHIVNTASVGGFLPSPMMAPYSATKFAVVALTESLHYELQMLQAPIRVSLLAPGPVKSEIFADPFGDAGDNPMVQQFVTTMRQMLDQHGLTPDEFAERAFAGIREGKYWLIPQPETIDDALRQRTDAILARHNPMLPSY